MIKTEEAHFENVKVDRVLHPELDRIPFSAMVQFYKEL